MLLLPLTAGGCEPHRRVVACAVACAVGVAASSFAGGCLRADDTPAAQTAGTGQAGGEVRGVWASGGEMIRGGAREYARLLKRSNVNTVYLSVYNDGRPSWGSTAWARATGESRGAWVGHLPQKNLVRALKDEGIVVIGWVESGFSLGSDGSEIANRHPDWLQKDARGNTRGDEHPEFGGLRFLSPGSEPAMEYFSDAMAELANPEFGFDAIQLERIRYTSKNGKAMGHEQATVSQANGRGHNSTRRELATNALKLIVKKIRAVNPDLKVTLGADGYYTVDQFLQPWGWWLKEGFVDHVEVQAYSRDMRGFGIHLSEIDKLVGSLKAKVTIGYRAMDRNDASRVDAQIRHAKARGWRNAALFGDSGNSYFADDNYKALSSPGGLWSTWFAHPFLKPGPIPEGTPIQQAPAQIIAEPYAEESNVEILETNFTASGATTTLKTTPTSDAHLPDGPVCVLRAGDAIRAEPGSVQGTLGADGYVSLVLALPVEGCSHYHNAAGQRLHVWGGHFRRR